MVESAVKKIIAAFTGFIALPYGRQLIVFIISLMPILELRGGLIAASLLGLEPVESYVITFIGNMLPVPFILEFINRILKWMRSSKIGFLNRFANWLYKKADKHKGQIKKYGFWGLVLFVGIPLPGTGAWTGCLVASILNMNKQKAFLATLLGVLMASVIMMLISFGLLRAII